MEEESYPCTCSSASERIHCKEMCDDRRKPKKVLGRIGRRKWDHKKYGIKAHGGMLDLFDNEVKLTYRITDEEYDSILEVLTEEEEKVFITSDPSFSVKRQMINILNKYVDYEK